MGLVSEYVPHNSADVILNFYGSTTALYSIVNGTVALMLASLIFLALENKNRVLVYYSFV